MVGNNNITKTPDRPVELLSFIVLIPAQPALHTRLVETELFVEEIYNCKILKILFLLLLTCTYLPKYKY